MKYTDLVRIVGDLEKRWRWRSGHAARLPRGRYSPLVRTRVRHTHYLQFFAVRQRIKGKYAAVEQSIEDRDLPVVVDLGINYTQEPSMIPDQLAPMGVPRPVVEDSVGMDLEQGVIAHYWSSFQNHRAWVRSGLAPDRWSKPCPFYHCEQADFHLVMTNFSPWITMESWVTEMCSKSTGLGAALLFEPPYRPISPSWPFDHLDDLVNTLGREVALWIGHGLWAVPHLFRSFVARHNIESWMLARNMTRKWKPIVRKGIVKFL